MVRPSLVALALLTAGHSPLDRQSSGPPYSPEDALGMFEIEDGFRVELFAAEPLISDPIAMEVDEAGRVYVLELKAYPDREARISTIRLLEDTDGDGLPDTSTVFADDLWMPKGIMRWKRGLLVADAPDVLYLEDTDGDGRADRREVLLTGFGTANPQLGVNSPVYGLDNWVHFAHSSAETVLKWPDGREDPLPDVSRRNFRYRTETGQIEAQAASSQFGHGFDAWGRQFLSSNANHLYQEIVPARYLARNPSLLLESTTEELPDHGAKAEVFPITVSPHHQLFTDVGVFTSASGLTLYLGGAFPKGYEGATFVGEPVHNVVHADRLEERGASFVARRFRDRREFLASRDSWFRPVNFYVGPDGALYVIDYYREIIEQPKFLSDEVIASGALYRGSDRGRIWRVTPEEGLPLNWVGRLGLGQAPAEALVAALEQPNAWYRWTAQRLLVERGDRSAAGALERLFAGTDSPEARVHALWTLEGLGLLGPELIRAALRDRSAGVRENAIRMAELHLEEAPSLAADLVAMHGDAEGLAAYQLLLTLGSLPGDAANFARERLLLDNVDDERMQVAGLSASEVDARGLFGAAVRTLTAEPTQGRRSFFRRLGELIAMRSDPEGAAAVLGQALAPGADSGGGWWRGEVLRGLAQGLSRSPREPARFTAERSLLVHLFFSTDDALLRAAALAMIDVLGLPAEPADSGALARAASLAGDAAADPELRADALSLLASQAPAEHAEIFRAAIAPNEALEVQLAAVRGLKRVPGPEVAEFLIASWGALTPQVRTEAVDLLVQEQSRIPLLLDALERGEVQPSAIGWYRSKRLMNYEDPRLRARARALLSPEEITDEEVVARYAASLAMRGNPARGEMVFARACSMCHQVGGRVGVAFGPDLSTVRSRRGESLLADILLPNREIASGYEQWVVELKTGEHVLGVIPSETPNSVTVRSIAGAERTVARGEIASMQAVNRSAMPEGLGQQIGVEEMADLIAFLTGAR